MAHDAVSRYNTSSSFFSRDHLVLVSLFVALMVIIVGPVYCVPPRQQAATTSILCPSGVRLQDGVCVSRRDVFPLKSDVSPPQLYISVIYLQNNDP